MDKLEALDVAEINLRKIEAIVSNWRRRVENPLSFARFDEDHPYAFKLAYDKAFLSYLCAREKWVQANLEVQKARRAYESLE